MLFTPFLAACFIVSTRKLDPRPLAQAQPRPNLYTQTLETLSHTFTGSSDAGIHVS